MTTRQRIHGLAVPFGRFSAPVPDGRGSWHREQFARGAFDTGLRGGIQLQVAHDARRVLAATRTSTLAVWPAADGLHFVADVEDGASLLRDYPHASIRFRLGFEREWRDGAGQWVTRERAELIEISLVSSPAFEETWVRALGPVAACGAFA